MALVSVRGIVFRGSVRRLFYILHLTSSGGHGSLRSVTFLVNVVSPPPGCRAACRCRLARTWAHRGRRTGRRTRRRPAGPRCGCRWASCFRPSRLAARASWALSCDDVALATLGQRLEQQIPRSRAGPWRKLHVQGHCGWQAQHACPPRAPDSLHAHPAPLSANGGGGESGQVCGYGGALAPSQHPLATLQLIRHPVSPLARAGRTWHRGLRRSCAPWGQPYQVLLGPN